MASDYAIQRLQGKIAPADYSNIGVPSSVPQATSKYYQYQPVSQPQQNTILDQGKKQVTAGLGFLADKLSTPSYAFGGFLRSAKKEADIRAGQGFSGIMPTIQAGIKGINEGIKNKVTPGTYLTEDLMKEKNPIKKATVGFATDLVADPLNLAGGVITKGSKLLKLDRAASKLNTAVKSTKAVQKVTQFSKTNPYIYKPMEAIVNPYFRNPEAGKVIEATKEAIKGRVSNLYRLIDESRKGLSRAEQMRVGQLLEGGIATSKTDQRLVEIANQFRKTAEEVGQEAVKTGLLNPRSFEKYRGQYMSHIWRQVNEGGNIVSDIPKIAGNFFKKRTGAKGYVKEYAAPVFKGLGTEMKDVEAAKMYQEIGRRFGSDTAKEGYKYVEDIAKNKGGEVLNKTMLPEAVIDYINRSKPIAKKGLGWDIYDKGMNAWKAGKTIYNPAYHVRNLFSNQILSDLQTGKGLPSTVYNYVKNTRKYLGKGDQTFVNEAKDAGLIGRKYFGQAIEDLLNTGFNKESKIKKVLSAPSKFQNFSEESAKLNVFTQLRKEGMSIPEAVKKTEEALFSPYRIPQGERNFMNRAVPFYSFTRQAAPFVAKKLVTHPERFTKYIKAEKAVEQLSENNKPDESKLPDYMKGMVRTPFKDKEGKSQYFNPQYIYPWGNFMTESGVSPLFGINVHPAIQEYAAQVTGVDPYYKSKFVREAMPTSEQNKARGEHLYRTIAPSLLNAITGKILPSVKQQPDYAGRKRDVGTTLLGEIGGMKMYPYNEQEAGKQQNTSMYFINKDAQSEISRVMKDQSKNSAQKREAIKAIRQRMQERMLELTK